MDDLYREVLLEHYRNPVHRGRILKPEIKFEDSNPLCGDVVEMFARVEKGKIKSVKHQGKGCVICMASADLLAEELRGKTVEEMKNMTREDVNDLLGVKLNHTRIKCAMLPLVALKKGELKENSK